MIAKARAERLKARRLVRNFPHWEVIIRRNEGEVNDT